MEWCAKHDVHRRNTMTPTGQARPTGGAPDPVGLAVAEKMQERLRPAEIILLGSRAAGDHRPRLRRRPHGRLCRRGRRQGDGRDP